MKKFLFKTGIFFLPFLFFIIVYFILDPFKVLYKYDAYFNPSETGCVFLNTNYVSTTNFDNHYEEFKYNSFIFGSSRAFFYRISDWQKYIDNEPAYHFESGGEALYSIYKKILYLDKKNISIKHALLILDYDILIQDSQKNGHLGLSSPQLENYRNFFNFHLASIKGFLNLRFLYAYIDFRISGTIKPYMTRSFLIEHRPFSYDYKTNEIQFSYYEELIKKDKYYTDELMEVFFNRDSTESFSPPVIGETQKQMLRTIMAVFSKHNTNYKIIISPLYDQVRLATEDINFLKSLYGEKSVFDFSGINRITNNYRNYYENSHYRPQIAKQLMDQIYQESEKFQVQKK